MAKKGPRKFDKKRAAVTAERPTRKNGKKSTIYKGFSKKKRILRKNRKIYDLQGLVSQKIENSMSRFCTLLALCSTHTPVVLKISSYSKPPRNSRTHVASTDHSTRTILAFWICVIFLLFVQKISLP